MNFKVEEYKERLTRLKQRMEEEDLNAVVLLKAEDILYISGFDQGTTSCSLLLYREQEPVMLVSPGWAKETVKEGTWIEDIRGVPELIQGVCDTTARLSPSKGKIGVDHVSRISNGAYGTLSNAIEGLVSFEKQMLQIREIKTQAEIEVIRESAKICDSLTEVFYSILRPGISETEIHAELVYALQKLGGRRMHISMTTGFPNYWMHFRPYPRKLQKGDLLFCEIAPQYRDQWTEVVRMAVVGKPTREYRDLFEIELEATKVLIGELSPGAVSSDIYKKMVEFARQTNIAMMESVDTMVHGAGLTLGDLPNVRYDSPDLIQKGQSLCVHAIFLFPYIASNFMLGEHVLVGDKGAELVSTMQTELISV